MSKLPSKIGRYDVLGTLGGGGMGDVFRVSDPVTRRILALKVLKFAYPRALHYFKREFRSIARLLHPNLVALYDLHYEAGQYFYTMELCDGYDLYVYINGHNHVVTDPAILCEPNRVARVRSVIVQMLRALAFLHNHDVVHRDIKPSNILVDRQGIVKLVDFGIVKEILPGGEGQSLSQVFGTSTYFSPEQSLGSRVTSATDLYALGVVLYELLTGTPPFEGESSEVAEMHRSVAPTPVLKVMPNAPQELAQLCMELLSKDPVQRPSAREALEFLKEPTQWAEDLTHLDYVGRHRERAILRTAFERVRAGQGRVVLLEGDPGLGKSALVKAFFAEARQLGASTFTGVCIPRDHVHMRGLDTLIERLAEAYRKQTARLLRSLPPSERAPMIADFTFLGELLAASEHEGPRGLSSGLGLHTLLSGLGRDRILALAVERIDVADKEMIDVLETLLTGGQVPPVLLVLSYSKQRIQANGRLAAFLEVASALPNVDMISLGPVTEEETAEILNEAFGQIPPTLARHVHQQTGGIPAFITRMVRYLVQEQPKAPPLLEDVLQHAILCLSVEAQTLLAAIAISPQAVPCDVLEQACGLEGHEVYDALAELEAADLARTQTAHGGRVEGMIEHPRLAELAIAVLHPNTQVLHERLALSHQALQSSAEEIRYHWNAIGKVERAWRFAAHSAADARASGHHDRVVSMLTLALEAPLPQNKRSEWIIALSESLVMIGHFLEAAHWLQRLLAEDPQEGSRWRARMCQLFLMGGDLAGFISNLKELPPLARVPLADLLLLFAPALARQLLGEADGFEARLVRARLLVDNPSAEQIEQAAELLTLCKVEVPNPTPRQDMLLVLTEAHVLWSKGHLDQADKFLEEASVRLFKHFGSFDLGGIRLDILRAQIALNRGQISRARSIGRGLLAETRERGLVGLQAIASILQANILLESGEPQAAARLLRAAARAWPERPLSTPHIELALAKARQLFYLRRFADADDALDALWFDEGLHGFLSRRIPMRIFAVLRSRICAARAFEAVRNGNRELMAQSLARLEAAIEGLRQLQPYPADWILSFSVMRSILQGRALEGVKEMESYVSSHGWPDNPEKHARFRFILSAALEAAGKSGSEHWKKGQLISREAGAALPPECDVFGAPAGL